MCAPLLVVCIIRCRQSACVRVQHLGQCRSADWGRCSLHNLRYRVARAADRFQTRLACLRQGIGRSDESISLSQTLSDVTDLTR